MKCYLLIAFLVFANASHAHIVLTDPQAHTGSYYKASLRVGHGCNGSPTTAITVQIPSGFEGAKPQPKSGWTTEVKKAKLDKPYNSHGKRIDEDVVELRWFALSKDNALPDEQFDEFSFMAKLPDQTGPVWIKVMQSCEKGQNDWSQTPAKGVSAQGLQSPAALLMIKGESIAPSNAIVQVIDAWVRPTVKGQQTTGVYLKITARESIRLVGVRSSFSNAAEIHEMKMNKDVMTMSALESLELPAGETIELKPGGMHIMLTGLKSAIQKNTKVPLILLLKDSKGVQSQISVSAESLSGAPLLKNSGAVHQH